MINIQNNRVGLLFLVFTISVITACATLEGSVKLENTEASLSQIGKAISASFPGGIQHQSENGRGFKSAFFDADLDPDYDEKQTTTRYYAEAIILGERRPYDVEIAVYEENRRSLVADFSDPQPAEQMTKKIFRTFKSRLNQSREGRNLIDGFRAF